MDNSKEINTQPIKEIENNEKSNIDYKPESKVFVEIGDFNKLKQQYEKLQYDFLNLQNHLKQVDKENEKGKETTQDKPEWFI